MELWELHPVAWWLPGMVIFTHCRALMQTLGGFGREDVGEAVLLADNYQKTEGMRSVVQRPTSNLKLEYILSASVRQLHLSCGQYKPRPVSGCGRPRGKRSFQRAVPNLCAYQQGQSHLHHRRQRVHLIAAFLPGSECFEAHHFISSTVGFRGKTPFKAKSHAFPGGRCGNSVAAAFSTLVFFVALTPLDFSALCDGFNLKAY
ncbi:hypothetical protein PoB_001741500 [Plakobranchus ocellatus]|uniref:Uncharacterized protein n=1 Tax=Plakobranchus ocellatus TaxID=259542 RepID=A0AAV3Z8L9_9GAST|nr:hypothetical protein PoB_001741500 [Plakobranchus ocellatus]